jgi:hypothetical protein
MTDENSSISEAPELGVWQGSTFVPIAEVKKRIEDAKKKGPYGSCWICGREFTVADDECKHTFD